MSKHPLYNNSGLQRDNKSHVLYALADKKIELKHLKDEYQEKLLKLQGDISAIETTICLFDGDCGKTIKKIDDKVAKSSKNKAQIERNRYFAKGEAKKLILDVLRVSEEPLDTEAISLKIQGIKEIAKDNIVLNKKIQKTIVSTLRQLEQNNIINQVGKSGLTITWGIKPLESAS